MLFFSANDGSHGVELWKSDGTAAGTVLLKDINPGSGDSFPTNLITINGSLMFVIKEANGSTLWISDGTAAGTRPAAAINSALEGFIYELAAVSGELFLAVGDANYARALWRSDGTTAGTKLVRQFEIPFSSESAILIGPGAAAAAQPQGSDGRGLDAVLRRL